MHSLRNIWVAVGATGLLALGGCGGSSSSDDSASTGSLSLNVTDAAVDDASQVVVQFDGVEIKPANGERITFDFDSPRQIDLLALQGNDSEALIDAAQVPAGAYEWIRLMVTGERSSLESFVEIDGGQHPLWVPSGMQTGLKLVSGFTVPAGGAANFTIDFDLRKSVVKPGQSGQPYILQPALRLVDNSAVGTLVGTVDTTTASAEGCAPAAYVFEGLDASTDDEGSANPPLTSALISLNEASGEYGFTVGFVNEGDYTVAWTCEADLDDPTADDDMVFEATANATVTEGETTEVVFQ